MEEITLTMLHENQEAMKELLMELMEIVSGEKKKAKKLADSKEITLSIPPLPNAKAAALLKMSTRQLQRVRRQYRLKWERRGREIYYNLTSILDAIHRLDLQWDNAVFEKIQSAYLNRPVLR